MYSMKQSVVLALLTCLCLSSCAPGKEIIAIDPGKTTGILRVRGSHKSFDVWYFDAPIKTWKPATIKDLNEKAFIFFDYPDTTATHKAG